jgi:hypothetical protein
MLRVSRGGGQISCFLPLVGRAAHIPKVFSSENCVAVSALLDHGVLRQFLIDLKINHKPPFHWLALLE